MNPPAKNAGLYVHIPFCAQKCAYCDFASFAGREREFEAYIAALSREIIARRGLFEYFETLYIGGGTPSVLPLGTIARIMERIRASFDIAHDAEITIEANPHSLTPEKLIEYTACGINRVSLGVQSLSESLLRTLGRAHTAADAQRAMRLLNESGVSWSADAMLSLPGQTLADVSATLSEIIEAGPGHISAYPLILEEGTPLARAAACGELSPLHEDDAYALETHAVALLEACGYARYEVSSFAKPGRQSRHNLNYWNNGAYLGLGAAAHGAYRSCGVWTRTQNTPDISAYIGGAPAIETPVPRSDEMFETVMLALRKVEGLRLDAFVDRFGERFERRYAPAIASLIKEGLLTLSPAFAALTPRGMELQNLALVRFL